MDHIPDEDMPYVDKAAHAVSQQRHAEVTRAGVLAGRDPGAGCRAAGEGSVQTVRSWTAKS